MTQHRSNAPLYRPGIAQAKRLVAEAARRSGAAGSLSARVELVGEIGPGKAVSLAGVKQQLARAPHAARLLMVIDSIGGNVHEAFAIYGALREHPATIRAIVVGDCASAAIVPLMAADHRRLGRAGKLMVHRAHLDRRHVGIGKARLTAARFRSYAELLAEADDRILDLLIERTGTPRALLVRAMRTGKQLRPIDARALGLVHEFDGSPPVDPSWPQRLAAASQAGVAFDFPSHMFTSGYLAACRAAGPLSKGR